MTCRIVWAHLPVVLVSTQATSRERQLLVEEIIYQFFNKRMYQAQMMLAPFGLPALCLWSLVQKEW